MFTLRCNTQSQVTPAHSWPRRHQPPPSGAAHAPERLRPAHQAACDNNCSWCAQQSLQPSQHIGDLDGGHVAVGVESPPWQRSWQAATNCRRARDSAGNAQQQPPFLREDIAGPPPHRLRKRRPVARLKAHQHVGDLLNGGLVVVVHARRRATPDISPITLLFPAQPACILRITAGRCKSALTG
jgi:hypothetical protein